MYQEEYYQDKIDYQSLDNDTLSVSNSSLDSNEKAYRKVEYTLKMGDPGYYSYKKKVGFENVKIECHVTDLFKNIQLFAAFLRFHKCPAFLKEKKSLY